MSNQSLPEGVERYRPGEEDGVDYGFSEMHQDPDGEWIRVSDLPKIIDQAKQEERKRLLSKRALQAAADKFSGDEPANAADRNEVRIEFEAAFAALDQEDSGGTV